jgi:tRNA pseudouridine38-40 synthase
MATTRWLVRFGYDGRPFYGWARQPGLRTVEGEILAGIERRGIAPDPAGARVDVASRTDRGVSARGNALALHSPLPGDALLRALNGIAREIVFTDARQVSEGFRPRAAVARTYRYFEAEPVGSLAAYRKATALVVRDIDVRSFGRGLPSGEPLWRTISRFQVAQDGPGLVLEVEAPSFVWGMVRKLVAAVRKVAAGELERSVFQAAIAGRRRLTLPLAEPEPLLLWEVQYDTPWSVHTAAFADRQREYFRTERHAARVRHGMLPRIGELRFLPDEASMGAGTSEALSFR